MNNRSKAPRNSTRVSMSYSKAEADALERKLKQEQGGPLLNVYMRLKAQIDRRDGILAQCAEAAE